MNYRVPLIETVKEYKKVVLMANLIKLIRIFLMNVLMEKAIGCLTNG